MIRRFRYSLIILILFLPLSVFSQKKDFGIWYGISAEHKLSKKLEIDLSTNIRTFENASKSKRLSLKEEPHMICTNIYLLPDHTD